MDNLSMTGILHPLANFKSCTATDKSLVVGNMGIQMTTSCMPVQPMQTAATSMA
jgi:hypothetical protein